MSNLTKEQIDQFFIEQFASFEQQLNGEKELPLHKIRKQAFAHYKYTNIAKTFGKQLSVDALSTEASISAAVISKHAIVDLEAINLIFVNGVLDLSQSDLEDLPAGLIIAPFKEAQTNYAADFEVYFNKENIAGADEFYHLNTAFTNGGAFIKVEKSVIIEKPITCYFFSTAEENDVVSQPRNLVIAGENSQATLIENYITLGGNTSFTNAVTEITLEQDAIFNYYKYQKESAKAIQVGATMVEQRGKSVFNSATFSFSGMMIRNNLNVTIKQPHSETHMYGLYLLDGKSHVDNHSVVDHIAPDCESNELYKGVLDEKSTGVFNGKIFVRQAAQRTNAFQSNGNILLSDTAEIDTKPQLEIWADDVKCSHGATVGQLNPDQLFYLKARGLDEKTAKSILLKAFASDVLSVVKVAALRALIEKNIEERI
jgi:Fe-S cluster assembly protein SufD